MTLKLEYNCTQAEFKEAQALGECGGKPKWRALAVNLLWMPLVLITILLDMKRNHAPKDRAWSIAAVVAMVAVMLVIYIVLGIFKWRAREKAGVPLRLEVSEAGLVFAGGSRTTMAWTAFSACLESPALFVLVSRSKKSLYVVPKRAFPDESAQDWFRTLANQGVGTTAMPVEAIMPGRFTPKGIALTVRMGFRDHLIRVVTSWRIRGIGLGVLVLVTSVCLFTPDQPDAVRSRSETLAFVLAVTTPMMLAFPPLVALIAWVSERKWRTPQHVALSSKGIEFATSHASGVLPWSTYKYYLENRWTFFVWQPNGSTWFMLPKREFASPSEVEQCRELLRTNLKVSRWFYL